eukprot:TCONS_00023859-protein
MKWILLIQLFFVIIVPHDCLVSVKKTLTQEKEAFLRRQEEWVDNYHHYFVPSKSYYCKKRVWRACTKESCGETCAVGRCVGYNQCQYITHKLKEATHTGKCIHQIDLSTQQQAETSIKMYGTENKNPFLKIQNCIWKIKLSTRNKTEISFRHFNMTSETTCTQSMIALRSFEDRNIFFYCSTIQPVTERALIVDESEGLILEVNRGDWEPSEGFVLKLK